MYFPCDLVRYISAFFWPVSTTVSYDPKKRHTPHTQTHRYHTTHTHTHTYIGRPHIALPKRINPFIAFIGGDMKQFQQGELKQQLAQPELRVHCKRPQNRTQKIHKNKFKKKNHKKKLSFSLCDSI